MGLESNSKKLLSFKTCMCACACACECERERDRERKLYLDMYFYYGGFLSNSLLILADETDSQSWRSPLKAISEFFKGDPKGDFMETGLHFPIGCCSNLCNPNASCYLHP